MGIVPGRLVILPESDVTYGEHTVTYRDRISQCEQLFGLIEQKYTVAPSNRRWLYLNACTEIRNAMYFRHGRILKKLSVIPYDKRRNSDIRIIMGSMMNDCQRYLHKLQDVLEQIEDK